MANPNIMAGLWVDNQAEEMSKFYMDVFPNSKVLDTAYHNAASASQSENTAAGSVLTIDIEIEGQRFQFLNGGPYFQMNPSISFFVNFDPLNDTDDQKAEDRLNQTWEKLLEGGKILMPLQEYDFSKRYGWIQDKFGVSWQLILTDPEGDVRPVIVPSMLFVGEQYGKAEEAADFYLSVFKDSQKGIVARYPAGMPSDKEGNIMYMDFRLLGTWFAAMDSGQKHDFNFNEGISLVIECDDQAEVDYYWEKLSKVPEAEACGWCKDQFGVSWQVVPRGLNQVVFQEDSEKSLKATEAMLKMKKLDLAEIKAAAEA